MLKGYPPVQSAEANMIVSSKNVVVPKKEMFILLVEDV